MTPCKLVNTCRGFEEPPEFILLPRGEDKLLHLIFVTLQTIRCHVSEDSTCDSYHRNDVISRRHQRLGSQILSRILVFQKEKPQNQK